MSDDEFPLNLHYADDQPHWLDVEATLARGRRLRSRRRLGVTLSAVVPVVVAALVLGLAHATPGRDQIPAGPGPGPNPRPIASPSTDGMSFGVKLLQNLSPLEKQVLADKKVTPQEYAEAQQHVIGCLKASGLDGYYDSDGGLTVMWGSSAAPGEGEDGHGNSPQDRAMFNCTSQIDAIQGVWDLENKPSHQEIAQYTKQFIDCMRGHGVDLPADATLEQAAAAFEKDLPMPTATDAPTTDGLADAHAACQKALDKASYAPPPGLAEALKNLTIAP